MGADELQLWRLRARVTVKGDARSLAWIQERGRRYFDFNRAFPPEESWQVFAGREAAPSLAWQAFNRGIPAAPCRYLLNASHRIIVVDAPAGAWRDLWTLRLVRDLLRWMLFRDGALFVHANLVAREGCGIAFVGKSGSGKSTLLLELLRKRAYSFVAEDDLALVRPDGGAVVGLGWPGCLRIRRSMLKFWPELADESGLRHPANELERRGNPETSLLRLFPEELEARFGCTVMPEAAVHALARLEWASTPSCVAMSSAQAGDALVEAWDLLPERKAGARPKYQVGGETQWRECCFNPPLFDFFGLPRGFSDAHVRVAAASMAGYMLRHNGKAEILSHPSLRVGARS